MKHGSLLRNLLTIPLSWLYSFGVKVRNFMFKCGILKSVKFDEPVIVVGNITAGGTGKTPATEYIIRLLKNEFRVAVVSRGYKRKTGGYVLSNMCSTPREIGDEPCQMKKKFNDITLAVDSNRVRAIRRIKENVQPLPDVYVLDDAYQHRYVQPGLSILLINYNNLIYEDKMLPWGMLREPVNAKDRADIVIVTKCPDDIQPMDLRVVMNRLELYPYQTLYFSQQEYEEISPIFKSEVSETLKTSDLIEYSVLVVSGIANSDTFEEYVGSKSKAIVCMSFLDHHKMHERDYEKIKKVYRNIDSDKKIILTTEKDAVKMVTDKKFPESLKPFVYAVPLRMKFVRNSKSFDKQIIDYVRKNRSNM